MCNVYFTHTHLETASNTPMQCNCRSMVHDALVDTIASIGTERILKLSLNVDNHCLYTVKVNTTQPTHHQLTLHLHTTVFRVDTVLAMDRTTTAGELI